MKYLLFLIPLMSFLNFTYAQMKVKVQSEYDIRAGAEGEKKLIFVLSKKSYFDQKGFITEIQTYGKKKLVLDTQKVMLADGTEQLKQNASWPEDMNEIGRIEKFTLNDDKSIYSAGYEIWNLNDTFRFQNTYTPESPGVYIVSSVTEVPYASATYFCDLHFNVLQNEAKSFRKYDDAGQITSKHYMSDDEQGVIRKGMIKYYTYHLNGSLKKDSVMQQGQTIINTTYTYDELNRIIMQDQFIKRKNKNEHNSIRSEYNDEGQIIKEYQNTYWVRAYQYLYY